MKWRDVRQGNFVRRPVSYLCRMWAGSIVDSSHNWEENLLFNNTVLTPGTYGWTVAVSRPIAWKL